jgi:hypothetical protein
MTTQDKTTENYTTVLASAEWVLDLRLMGSEID